MKLLACFLCTTLLSTLAAGTFGACLTDTTQSDFQSGIANNVDVNITPGSVVLTKSVAIDQQNQTVGINGEVLKTTLWVGQTFVPGLSGRLTRADVNLFCNSCLGTPPSIIVGVRATSGGLPTGPDLALATIPTISNVGAAAFYTAIFATPATLTAGTTYALVIRPSTNPSVGTFAVTFQHAATVAEDAYPNGALLFSTTTGSTWSVQPFNTGDPTGDIGFITYIHDGYAASGDLTSDIQDSMPAPGATPAWTSLAWTATMPAQTTLSFQIAASNSSSGPFTFVGPDTTAATFFSTSGASLSQFNGNRYLKYRSYLTSASSTATPTLNDVTLCNSTSSSADLSISNSDGVTSTTTGSMITYTITATNPGPANVTGANVVDVFPAEIGCIWTCAASSGAACTASSWGNIDDSVNLPSGSNVTYTAMCAVASNATGSLVNTATITPPAGVSDGNLANNSMTDIDTLMVNTNVTMALTSDISYVRLGDVLHYTIDVSNMNGPSDAVVNVLDALPPQLVLGQWTCAGSGSAACGSGIGDMLSDTATVPAGGMVEYTYAAMVVGENAGGMVGDSASASLQFGTNQPSGVIVANHQDIVVVFRADFEAQP